MTVQTHSFNRSSARSYGNNLQNRVRLDCSDSKALSRLHVLMYTGITIIQVPLRSFTVRVPLNFFTIRVPLNFFTIRGAEQSTTLSCHHSLLGTDENRNVLSVTSMTTAQLNLRALYLTQGQVKSSQVKSRYFNHPSQSNAANSQGSLIKIKKK